MDRTVLVAVAVVLGSLAAEYYLATDWRLTNRAADNKAFILKLLETEPGDVQAAAERCRTAELFVNDAAKVHWTPDEITSAKQLVADLCRK